MGKRGQAGIQVALIVICLILVLVLILVLAVPGNLTGRTTSRDSRDRDCEFVRVPYTARETYYDYNYGDRLDYRVEYHAYEVNYRTSGAYRDRFVVRIRNTDDRDGYFTVRFYFYDDDGDRTTRTVRKHLDDGEAKTFSYPNYDYDRSNWDFRVYPERTYNSHYYDSYPRTRYVTKYRWVERCF